MEKVTEEIKKEFKDKINFVFYDVNTDEDYDKAEKFKINLIPSQVFLDKNGKEYHRHQGILSVKEIRKIILLGFKIDQ